MLILNYAQIIMDCVQTKVLKATKEVLGPKPKEINYWITPNNVRYIHQKTRHQETFRPKLIRI